MKPIMTIDDEKWNEFVERLEGSEGIDAKQDDKGEWCWCCPAGREKPGAKRILKVMGYNIKKSCDYFENHGGYCDCEILFNVDTVK